MNNTKNIALISGGYSSEKIVSKKSADNVFKALKKKYANVFWLEIDTEKWVCILQNKEYIIDKNDFSVVVDNTKIVFDFAYCIIHGSPAEDGLLPAYFELLNIPYSCSNPLASQVTFDKAATIRYAKALQIPIAKSIEYSKAEFNKKGIPEIDFKYPIYIKACRSGSSFGVSKIKSKTEIENGLLEAFKHDDNCLIEEGMIGTEVTSGVYKLNNKILPIAITEVVPHNDFFDFKSKYNGESDEITPARISKEMYAKVTDLAMDIYSKFNLDGICRIDFIIENETAKLIEINTIPGMTNESFIPQQIEYIKDTLEDFLYQLIQEKLQ